ncbi:2OG-Fe(II) oxygenase [Rhodococcus tukisamuensis]|uniref:2OG-Fe(II) oxygenase n=1 Tax=Rhodococcus tukisamuensis TaxID=168276 RepID=UPI0009346AF3|nr:2OG-Fe(II) oxygenase [Rhodococcus tukisamuensis]
MLDELRANRLVWVDEFVDARTCEFLCSELDFAYWHPSVVVRRDVDGALVSYRSEQRVSESTDDRWFSDDLLAELGRIEGRVCGLLGTGRRTLERWQAVRYRNRGRFRLHHDAGLFADDPEGERVTTIRLHLYTPGAGGATVFPYLGVRVGAVAGRLVLWQNLRSDGLADPDMRHAAQPVRRGRKSVLTTWARQHPGQGRVS